jgi:hypothetical protein
MATREQIGEALKRAHAAGDTEAARKLAQAYRDYQPPVAEQPEMESPGFMAGMGKGVVDAIEGVTDLFGVDDPLGLGDTSQADKAIAQSPAAAAGEFVGNVGATMPAMLIPGAGTIKGAAAIGAGLGALLNKGDFAARAKNAAAGAVGGAAGASLPYAAKVAGKVLAPFGGTKAKEGIIGDMLLRNVTDSADDVIRRLEAPNALVPGSQPTAAEVANSGGLAAVQRWAEQASPENYAFRRQGNAAARRAVIDAIAGTEAGMERAIARREVFAGPLYSAAKRQAVTVDDELRALLRRPSMQQALTKAEELAAETGAPIDPALRNAILSGDQPATISGEGLHWLKLGLDRVKKNPKEPLDAEMLRSIMDTSGKFEAWRERTIPDYAIAQKVYRKLSKPISRMEVGQELSKKVNSALSNHGEYTRETAETFARALDDLDAVAKRATGFKGAKANDILTAADKTALEKVAQELNRKAAADELGRGIGSNTFQNFAMNGIAESAGVPSVVSSLLQVAPVTRSLMNMGRSAGGAIYAGPQKEMQTMLADVLLDPKKTAQLMRSAQQQRVLDAIMMQRYGFLPSATGIGLVNYSQ